MECDEGPEPAVVTVAEVVDSEDESGDEEAEEEEEEEEGSDEGEEDWTYLYIISHAQSTFKCDIGSSQPGLVLGFEFSMTLYCINMAGALPGFNWCAGADFQSYTLLQAKKVYKTRHQAPVPTWIAMFWELACQR